MRSMQLNAPGLPLQLVNRDPLRPGAGQVLVRVQACGVCRTDLHIVDGELPGLDHPIVPGHEIVGTVAEIGPGAGDFSIGQRIGVPWLGWTCGRCRYCLAGRENLCDGARFTGYHIRRRLRRIRARRRPLLFFPAGRLRRCGGGALALRRADRLPLAQDGG
jgi:propanol-preferring alcohol dehydrogenase